MSEQKPRHGLFILLAVMILLAGALTAGVAAWAVVEPRTGEVQSAGVVSVPTVLGQTADEVLFYPWSVYSMEEQFKVAEKFREDFDTDSLLFPPDMCSVLNLAEIDQAAFYQAMEANAQGSHLYVRNLPCQLTSGTAATLNFAWSEGDSCCWSAVISPAEREELTPEQQEAALEQVKADLAEFLLRSWDDAIGPNLLWVREMIDFSMEEMFSEPIAALGGSIEAFVSETLGIGHFEMSLEGVVPSEMDRIGIGTLEEVIEEFTVCTGWSVQLITTPSQVVAVMSSGSMVVGIYYDIQLEQYSGYGVQNG